MVNHGLVLQGQASDPPTVQMWESSKVFAFLQLVMMPETRQTVVNLKYGLLKQVKVKLHLMNLFCFIKP